MIYFVSLILIIFVSDSSFIHVSAYSFQFHLVVHCRHKKVHFYKSFSPKTAGIAGPPSRSTGLFFGVLELFCSRAVFFVNFLFSCVQ